MKMLMNVKFPHEPFNTLVREGIAGEVLHKILDDLKPESIYFVEQGVDQSTRWSKALTCSQLVPKPLLPASLSTLKITRQR